MNREERCSKAFQDGHGLHAIPRGNGSSCTSADITSTEAVFQTLYQSSRRKYVCHWLHYASSAACLAVSKLDYYIYAWTQCCRISHGTGVQLASVNFIRVSFARSRSHRDALHFSTENGFRSVRWLVCISLEKWNIQEILLWKSMLSFRVCSKKLTYT